MKKNLLLNKLNIKRAAFITAVIFICVCFTACADDGTKTVKSYFDALNKADYTTAGKLLGDEHFYDEIINLDSDTLTYYEFRDAELFIELVYGSLEVEITESRATDYGYEVEGIVKAYNVEEVNLYHMNMSEEITSSVEYLNLNDYEKYIMLCETLEEIYRGMNENLYKIATPLTFSVKRNDDGWYIEPTNTLMDAISGGDNK